MGKILDWIGSEISNRDMAAFLMGVLIASIAIRIAS